MTKYKTRTVGTVEAPDFGKIAGFDPQQIGVDIGKTAAGDNGARRDELFQDHEVRVG